MQTRPTLPFPIIMPPRHRHVASAEGSQLIPGTGKRSADPESLPSSQKRARHEGPITSIELSTPQSNFDLRWRLAESLHGWSDRGSLFHTSLLVLMTYGQYPALDVHQFFAYWDEGDDMVAIPDGFMENGVTWPLCGYIPPTPEFTLGLERRWPYPPWPEHDFMEVDMDQSK